MLSQSVEDYLKAIYEIQETNDKVSTNSLSEKLDIAPASVTSMVKKLSKKKLITHKRYQGVRLTDSGRKIALEIIRHHRLVELYLKEALGVPWDQVHEEAEKWEHVLSEDLEDRIDKFLGYPTSDPHGSPIPSRDGTMILKDSKNLIEVEPGATVKIAEVSDHDSELLRYFGNMGLYPETKIKVVSVEPFKGPITLVVKGEKYSIGREAAKYISVTDLNAKEN
ncbi:MAG: metal-dependent transcriptional regulator [Candidatus Dadabacteria bacterium]|nr:metal-dependent transcriptional regulator [Candidatus Dadabacteria bacterium]NIQ13270.1 metal-dependent transcriptional regulator [Candidatus Dadabacteria bacterium]